MSDPFRVQLSRKKGFRLPENTVSVARPTLFGNPYAVGQPYRVRGATTHYVTDRLQAAGIFYAATHAALPDDYLYYDPHAWYLFVQRVKRKLRGKNLACWCPLDSPCHADVLLKIANAEPPHE